jgi:hypothetical protein
MKSFAETFSTYVGFSAPRKALVAGMLEALPKGRNLYGHSQFGHLPNEDCKWCLAEIIEVVALTN